MREKTISRTKHKDLKKITALVYDNVCKISINNKQVKLTLDNYCDLKILSEDGANSVVLTGIHKLTKRKDVLKIYVPNKRTKSEMVSEEQFLNEVNKLAKLKDERIVMIYDAYRSKEGLYVCTLEYVEGKTLRVWNQETHSDIDRILMLKEVLSIIIFYISHGVLHGDLHDKNILIDKYNKLHILDFGASLFGKNRDYEEERESYMAFTNTKNTLANIFDENYFSVHIMSNINKERAIDNSDVRKHSPYLIAKTLLAYVNYLDYLKQISVPKKMEDIYKLCYYVSEGFYFDYSYLIDKIYEVAKPINVDKLTIASMIADYWNDRLIPENGDNSDINNEFFYKSLNVYFNYYKSRIKLCNLLNLSHEEVRIMKLIDKTKKNSFDGFREELKHKFNTPNEEYDFCDSCRQLLYKSIECKFNNRFAFRWWLWYEINKFDYYSKF